MPGFGHKSACLQSPGHFHHIKRKETAILGKFTEGQPQKDNCTQGWVRFKKKKNLAKQLFCTGIVFTLLLGLSIVCWVVQLLWSPPALSPAIWSLE